MTLPELLPVTEALELIDGLRDTNVEPAGVILNRIPDDPFDPAERAALEEALRQRPMHGELAFRRMGAAREAEQQLREATDVPVFGLPDLSGAGDDEIHEGLGKRLGELMARG